MGGVCAKPSTSPDDGSLKLTVSDSDDGNQKRQSMNVLTPIGRAHKERKRLSRLHVDTDAGRGSLSLMESKLTKNALHLGESEDEEEEDSPLVFNKKMSITETSSTVSKLSEDEENLKLKQYQARHGQRNSIVEYIESVRRLQHQQLDFITKKRMGTLKTDQQNVVFLPRGGTYVSTAAGPVQFGLPPETIKDSMSMGLTLPTNYVLPKERFNLQTGINVAEFEFPAYFNFFLRHKRINIITTPDVEPLIRTIFQETLLGPKEVDPPPFYSDDVPKEAYPDLLAESKYFRKNPFKPSEELTVDTVLQFTFFNDEGVATLDDGVTIVDRGEQYAVMEGEEEIAVVSSSVILSPPPLVSESSEIFVPPAFGVTMLGNSHGFDPNGTTTGFVVWMNRRGIMVDPPPHSGAILKQHGIPSRMIQGVILTHCHADHDAGTFQKILEEGKIVLYTTRVIANSFLRKYSAISGLAMDFLQQLFEFREAVPGTMLSVYGGSLQFFYSLHSIPCVGFAAYCCGKSMVYSGDSFNDPEGIEKFYDQGVMSAARRDKLIRFPWHHTVILHEAGVPPIHTPMKTLTSLPEEVKERLYCVHVAPKDIPENSGLKTAPLGPDNTIVIADKRGADFQALEVLELVTRVDLFQDFPVDRSVELLNCARIVKYNQGHVLIEQGSYGDKLYIIAMGIVSVTVNGNLVKRLTVGDHFGEMSIVTQQPRTATISAHTDIELLEFTGHEFTYLVRETNVLERLRHLGSMQREQSWQMLEKNSVVHSLSSSQKTYLQSILHKREAEKHDLLWERGDKAKFAIFVDDGEFVFLRAKNQPPFRPGAFVGDMQAVLYGKPLTTTLVCKRPGTFYYVTKRHLLKFFDENPGVLVYFKDRFFVE